MTYSEASDLKRGDIPLPQRHGDGSSFVNEAADIIDGQIGHIYVTPIVLPDTSKNRPAVLLLKTISNNIASGRLIMDLSIAGEDNSLHAYGYRLYKDGMDALNRIIRGDVTLGDAEKIPAEETETPKLPTVYNEDQYSLVEGFYQQTSHGVPQSLLGGLSPYRRQGLDHYHG